MPIMKYALEKGGPKRLEISYKGNWKDFTIRLDGNVIGTVAEYEHLKTGQEFALPDGSILKVQLKFPGFQVFRNGKPLLLYDPSQMLKFSYTFTFFSAAANLFMGLSGSLFHTNLGNLPPAGMLSVGFGILLLVLGFFIMLKSTIALSIAAGILALDIILAIFYHPNLPLIILVIAIVFKLLVLLMMIQGFGAIKALKQEQALTTE
jgi:hypothetical protein